MTTTQRDRLTYLLSALGRPGDDCAAVLRSLRAAPPKGATSQRLLAELESLAADLDDAAVPL